MGTTGYVDGDGSTPWTKEYCHTLPSGYRVLDGWVFPLSWDLNFTQNWTSKDWGTYMDGHFRKKKKGSSIYLTSSSLIYDFIS